MAHTMLAAVVLVVAMATTAMADCSTPMTSYEFRQLFCESEVVFRGSSYQATSGLLRDMQGRRIEAARLWFTVHETYKGVTPSGGEVTVTHQWHQGVDPCPSGAFSDNGPEFLVFGNGTGSVAVDTCRHSFPWEDCVDQEFKDALPNIPCPAQP